VKADNNGEQMIRLRWFWLGMLFCVAIATGLLAAALVLLNAHGFSARDRPMAVEVWIGRKLRSAALPSDARGHTNPVANTPEALADARAHWADHCAICHANDGSGDTLIGKRTYPPAPDMRLPATQAMSDGELFFVIQNGIRLTAMPAWGGDSEQDAQDSWKLVHFIRHLPQLTAADKKEMEKLNPKSPDDLKEEEEEKRFLKGEDIDDQQIPHHHR
jgi:mono/diheme cytochrome c family protein